MLVNDSSEVIYFDNTPISNAEQVSLGFPRNMRCYARNVVKIDGKYYYAKKCSTWFNIVPYCSTWFNIAHFARKTVQRY